MDKIPGWKDLVVCGQYDNYGVASGYDHMCGFNDMVLVAKNLITDLVLLGTIATTLVFIWAGIKLVTSGGNPKQLDDAKRMLWNVVKGFVIMIAAWVVVYTILSALVGDEYLVFFGK